MNNIEKHFNLLGMKVKDKASELKGIVTSICFDLYGCIQADVRPYELDKEGKMQTGYWVDVNRLKIISQKPVMEVPNFKCGTQAEGKQGPANKPVKY